MCVCVWALGEEKMTQYGVVPLKQVDDCFI